MNDVPRPMLGTARVATAHGAILFDHERLAQADAELFDPGCWRDAQGESGQGGRGTVWFVRGEFGPGVLRHYRRGGLVGRMNRDRYLWRGEDATRSFREFRLLALLQARGFAVPAPLAAGYDRYGAFYRADILTGLIPDARTLAQRLHDDPPPAAVWRRIGETLAHFHGEGVYHADLNAHNVMIDAAQRIWLIDFDRGEIRAPEGEWPRENLQRLQRSLRKLGADPEHEAGDAWAELERGYGVSALRRLPT